MPLIAVQVITFKTPEMMQKNLRNTLRKAGIPEYSYKEQRAGFEVGHFEKAEGQTHIIWHTFGAGDEREDAAQDEMRAGLEQCAAVLLENYWIQLYVPNRLNLMHGRMHLRVLLRLSWLS
jgi:hypothetical protein